MPGHLGLLMFLSQQAEKGVILLPAITDCDYKVAATLWVGKEVTTLKDSLGKFLSVSIPSE